MKSLRLKAYVILALLIAQSALADGTRNYPGQLVLVTFLEARDWRTDLGTVETVYPDNKVDVKISSNYFFIAKKEVIKTVAFEVPVWANSHHQYFKSGDKIAGSKLTFTIRHIFSDGSVLFEGLDSLDIHADDKNDGTEGHHLDNFHLVESGCASHLSIAK